MPVDNKAVMRLPIRHFVVITRNQRALGFPTTDHDISMRMQEERETGLIGRGADSCDLTSTHSHVKSIRTTSASVPRVTWNPSVPALRASVVSCTEHSKSNILCWSWGNALWRSSMFALGFSSFVCFFLSITIRRAASADSPVSIPVKGRTIPHQLLPGGICPNPRRYFRDATKLPLSPDSCPAAVKLKLDHGPGLLRPHIALSALMWWKKAPNVIWKLWTQRNEELKKHFIWLKWKNEAGIESRFHSRFPSDELCSFSARSHYTSIKYALELQFASYCVSLWNYFPISTEDELCSPKQHSCGIETLRSDENHHQSRSAATFPQLVPSNSATTSGNFCSHWSGETNPWRKRHQRWTGWCVDILCFLKANQKHFWTWALKRQSSKIVAIDWTLAGPFRGKRRHWRSHQGSCATRSLRLFSRTMRLGHGSLHWTEEPGGTQLISAGL